MSKGVSLNESCAFVSSNKKITLCGCKGVGKYSEIQTFLKTLLSETYLVNFAQIEIVSWQRDKSVLIANLKLRFYTRTK